LKVELKQLFKHISLLAETRRRSVLVSDLLRAWQIYLIKLRNFLHASISISAFEPENIRAKAF
jgi:hypothetical protein